MSDRELELKQDRPTQDTETPDVTPKTNIGTWINVVLALIVASMTAFVVLDRRSESAASKAVAGVASDVCEIKLAVQAIDESQREVEKWQAATQEVLKHLQAQAERCEGHIERAERVWPKGAK